MALFPGLPRWAGTRKVKPIWILLKQENEWQWHQLGLMQVCISLQTDNHASTPPLEFFTDGWDALPATQPSASKHWRKNQKCWKILQLPGWCEENYCFVLWMNSALFSVIDKRVCGKCHMYVSFYCEQNCIALESVLLSLSIAFFLLVHVHL